MDKDLNEFMDRILVFEDVMVYRLFELVKFDILILIVYIVILRFFVIWVCCVVFVGEMDLLFVIIILICGILGFLVMLKIFVIVFIFVVVFVFFWGCGSDMVCFFR